MARPIHQLIAQTRGPDLMAAQGQAMQQLSAMQGVQGQKQQLATQKLQHEIGTKQLANMDTDRAEAVKRQAFEDAVKMRMGGASDEVVLGYLNQAGQGLNLPPVDPAVLEQIDAMARAGREPEPGFTLGTGQQRFDANGNVIAVVDPAPEKPEREPLKEVYNPQTGQMEYVPESHAIGMPSQPPKEPPKPADDLTPAEEAVDRAFASDYNEFIAQGGMADVQKQLKQLEEVKTYLNDPDTSAASGGVVSSIPKWFRDRLPGMGQGAAAQDTVEEVVQRNLRLVLGAQFTEREGQRLIERAYNPAQTEEENARRVGRLIEQIRGAAEAKMAAAQYYEQNGTLKGFKGRTQYSIDDFGLEDSPADDQAYPDGTVAEGPNGERMVMRGGDWIPLDKAVGRGATGSY